MEARPVTHPSADVLRAYALGKLEQASAGTIASHLEACPDCRQHVASLPGDSFLGRLQAGHRAHATPAPDQALPGSPRPKAADSGATPPPPLLNLPPELAGQAQYQILRELGHGGMGVVYLATNKLLGRTEVLKVVNKALLSRPGAVERFLQEIRAAARLNHPHVVAAYNALQLGECLVFAMEYVEGEDLGRLVQTRGPLPVAHACFYVQQAALGLQHAFEKGMVHRDIKPQNLILSRAGKRHIVKVLDFGLAKATRDKSVDHALTGAGKMLGTPDFIAPEQTMDAATVDIRADVYSLGCTLYYLLTGAPPFEAENLYAVLHAHHSVEARPLDQVRPDVPAGLAAVVGRMMAKDPAQRYQKPVEVAHALLPFIKPGAKGAKPKPNAPAGPEGIRWETLTDAGTTSLTTQTGLAASKAPSQVVPSAAKKKWRLAAGIALCVLLIGLVGLWAGGVFKVQTKDGTLVLEDLPDGAEVIVDGQKVTLTAKGGTAFEISVVAGKDHEVQVKKEGIKVFGTKVQIDAGGLRAITVRLEPLSGATEDPLPEKPADKPFVPLFNGKDLTGWKALASNKATWEVKDAVLSGRGDTGYLFHDGKGYENFHLRVEAMINDGGNSGVFFRAPFGPTTPQGHPAFGYEAQINITHKDPNKTGSLYLTHKIVAGLPNTLTELDKWFTLEVLANGPHVVVRVNGKVTADFIDLAVGTRSGRLALQVLDAATVVKFRKIEIKELPPGDLRLQYPHGPGGVFEQVKGNVWLERNGTWLGYFREHARNNDDDGGGTVRLNRKIENDKTGILHITRGNGAWWNVQGTTRWTRVFMGGWSVLPRTPPPEKAAAARVGEWAALLNGKDLTGWEAAGNKNVTWTYEDDALVGRASTDPAGLLLSDRADYENFHLRMETRLSEGAYSSLFLRCGPPNDGTTGNKCYAIRIGEATSVSPVTGTLALSAHFDEAVPLVLAEAAKIALKPGAWFPLEILVEGNRLRVLIEGKTVVDYTDTNETFTVGRLGLVCRGHAVVRFRKLEVKELPATKPGR